MGFVLAPAVTSWSMQCFRHDATPYAERETATGTKNTSDVHGDVVWSLVVLEFSKQIRVLNLTMYLRHSVGRPQQLQGGFGTCHGARRAIRKRVATTAARASAIELSKTKSAGSGCKRPRRVVAK